ncbi:hypothetical protein MLD38_035038 [Melastoma candidum]|uniref:Uncharacterized protein n=1 Tax=Melastoma candidum TaxID=119954 RepID=A0ACB9MBU4_9MYRT|nr:hypothetical protein MLD38_035038 [Melastoma candidum]
MRFLLAGESRWWRSWQCWRSTLCFREPWPPPSSTPLLITPHRGAAPSLRSRSLGLLGYCFRRWEVTVASLYVFCWRIRLFFLKSVKVARNGLILVSYNN